LRWLTMTLNILKLKKYVKAHRIMKKEPSPSELNSACTNILNLRRELISYHLESDDYEPGVITMKRSIKNLKIAITQKNWVAKAYKLEDLYSTICHIDSLEHYKVTKDLRNLFILKEKKSHINPILDKNSMEEISKQDVNSVFEPTLWRLENHAASMVVQLVNRVTI
jgi:hypothetical protein